MGVIYGYSEAEERMRNDKDTPNTTVALDHDFYTNNHAAVKRKDKEVYDAIHKHDGDDVGINGREQRKKPRSKHAMGGVVKERRDMN